MIAEVVFTLVETFINYSLQLFKQETNYPKDEGNYGEIVADFWPFL